MYKISRTERDGNLLNWLHAHQLSPFKPAEVTALKEHMLRGIPRPWYDAKSFAAFIFGVLSFGIMVAVTTYYYGEIVAFVCMWLYACSFWVWEKITELLRRHVTYWQRCTLMLDDFKISDSVCRDRWYGIERNLRYQNVGFTVSIEVLQHWGIAQAAILYVKHQGDTYAIDVWSSKGIQID